MRGEHNVGKLMFSADLGSSPHARGTHARTMGWVNFAGIIPACAGNTCVIYDIFILQKGSSPHARGTLEQMLTQVLAQGIIPACAGNTQLTDSESG